MKTSIEPIVLGIALACIMTAQTLGQRAATFRGATVVSSVAIEDICEIMQFRYGVPVTYEDPDWQWAGDFQNRPGQPYGLFRIRQTVNVPPELTPERTPVLNSAAFRRVLEEYNKTYGAPRYRVTESKLGLHVFPETARDATGEIVSAKNPLDTVVDIPVAQRSIADHLRVVCLAASGTAELSLQCGAVYAAKDPRWQEWWLTGLVDWGSSGLSARDALADLLSKAWVRVSWRLRCANPSTGDHVCVLNLEGVQAAK